jgi:hypothetical protein
MPPEMEPAYYYILKDLLECILVYLKVSILLSSPGYYIGRLGM